MNFCKNTLLAITFIFCLATSFAQYQLAFPGAEGYGKYTVGGRGGKVYEVTNLNDSGQGSLRAAVEAKGPRIVVFRVSGTIDLKSDLRIKNPSITIAGQTAPGDGICIKRYPLMISADEVIIRYIRVRFGDESGQDSDAISSRYVKNLILDHVSASWSVDETMSIYHCENMTIQWCMITESMFSSNHIKSNHGFGGIWGSNYSSYHHNLIAHHSSRNPRFASGCGNTDYRNNVLYNWGYRSCYGAEAKQKGNQKFNFSTINMVANYYKPGPATAPGKKAEFADPSSRGDNDKGHWYVADNFMEGSPSVTNDNWSGVRGSKYIKLDQPWDAMPINQHTAEEAYFAVLDSAGCSLPTRDVVDARIIEEVRSGTATYEGVYKTIKKVADKSKITGIIDSQNDVGGWPELKNAPAPTDTDHDGMPDAWETRYGLDSSDVSDASRDKDKDGYTNVEEYLNGTDPTVFVDYTKPENNINTLDAMKSGSTPEAEPHAIHVTAAGFRPGANIRAFDGKDHLDFVIDTATPIPFSQSAVKQSLEVASLGPNSDLPYFTVRFAMPIPPAYTETEVAALTGMDAWVFHHNHSPGFEILPNGDALAVYFSAPVGKSEADNSTSFVQARLRYGSEDWDMPELFFKTQGQNDQSGLLWNDNGKIWFFGGGRNISDFVPFRMATSTDNGATWTYAIPQLDKAATRYTAQPITSAFRGPGRSIYMAMDGDGAESFLWRSSDDGIHWQDMGGRTGGRHSAIVPLDDQGNLLSIGGKNSDVDGWSPRNVSADWGATWSESTPSPFPPLGSVQRPSMIRLASGDLLFVSDSYMHKKKIAPPKGWQYGDNCFVAVSKDNGDTWHIKSIPVQIPQRHRIEHPSLGYVTARQGPNGVIHLLTTATLPPLHYEFNEAWIWSDAGDIAPETSDGILKRYTEYYPNGQLHSKWTARICPKGRYLLHGVQTDYYEDGTMQHQATYVNGRKTGQEAFWSPDGHKLWAWQRDLEANRAVWTHYWPNGKKKIESTWNIKPEARDLRRQFFGYVAEGPSLHWNLKGDLVFTHHFVNGNLTESK